MVDPVCKLIMCLRTRGIKLEVRDGKLRCRAPRGVTISDDEKELLTDYGAGIEAILNPDESLPDVLVVPAAVPNNVVDIRACIDSQRIRRFA